MTVTHRDVLFAALVWSPVILAWLGDVASGGAVSGAARGAFDHGRAQAASEVRRARQAVADNTRASLRKRIEDGKARGPKSAIWWGAAAVTAARKVHRSMKGLRDGATGKGSSSLPSAGPWRRVRDAAVAGAGARYRDARDAAKARRAAGPSVRERVRQARRNASAWRHPETGAVATGVCDGCGVMAARTALAPDGPWLLCAGCRAPAVPDDTGTADALEAPAGAVEGAGITGADTQGELMAKTDKELLARAHPADLRELAKRELDRGHLGASRAYLEHAKEIEAATRGLPRRGQIARRTAQPAHRPPAAVTPRGGTVTTHGEGMRFGGEIIEALDRMARCKEGMLGALTTVDAHGDQIRAIQVWADHERAVQAHWRTLIETVDARVRPFIDTLNGEGRKVAGVIDHYSEV